MVENFDGGMCNCFCQAQPQLQPQLWLRLSLIFISPHHPHPHPPDLKSREYNFLGQPCLQFQLKLSSEDILTKLLIFSKLQLNLKLNLT